MPHDANGIELKAGDRVYLPVDVVEITSTEEGSCNITIDGVIAQAGGYKPRVAVSASQVVKEPPNDLVMSEEDLRDLIDLRSRNAFLESEVNRLAKPFNDALLSKDRDWKFTEPRAGELVNCGCGKTYHTATESGQCPDHAPLATPEVEVLPTDPSQPVPPAL